MKVETHDDVTDETKVVDITDAYDPVEIIKATDEALGNPEGVRNCLLTSNLFCSNLCVWKRDW